MTKSVFTVFWVDINDGSAVTTWLGAVSYVSLDWNVHICCEVQEAGFSATSSTNVYPVLVPNRAIHSLSITRERPTGVMCQVVNKGFAV